MWNHPSEPYDSLPPPPSREVLETIPVLRKVISAARALAELKGKCQTLPDPGLLLDSIVLQESKDSSAIENIVTTNDQLYQAILHPLDHAPAEVKEVLRYREAIHAGMLALERTGGISTSTAIAVVQRIRGTTVVLRNRPGTKLTNPATGQVIYTPPEHDTVPGHMAAWERFVNSEDGPDPLVRMAAMHYWFEAIHPFSDGNGRTGRILNVLHLVQAELLQIPILYHSSYILQHKNEYYRRLRQVTEQDAWEPWVLFMLEAVERTAALTLQLIEDILTLRERTAEVIRGISQKIPVGDLTTLLFTHPYLKIATLMDHQLGSRPTVTKYLRALSDPACGILREKRTQKEVYFINHQLMDLLSRRQG